MSGPSAVPVTLRLAGEFTVLEALAKVRLIANGFKKVTSLQFTLQWDPAVLQYIGVAELGLAGLGLGNFGTTLTDGGKLLFSWDDPDGVGVSLPDGATLYTLELKAAGTGAALASVRFSDNPTVREVTIGGAIAPLATEDGAIEPSSPNARIEILVMTDATGRRVGVAVATVSGRNYVLEATESISQPQWKKLNEVAGNGAIQVLIEEGPRDPHRFYRVRME